MNLKYLYAFLLLVLFLRVYEGFDTPLKTIFVEEHLVQYIPYADGHLLLEPVYYSGAKTPSFWMVKANDLDLATFTKLHHRLDTSYVLTGALAPQFPRHFSVHDVGVGELVEVVSGF